jgi:hypothetical protein
MHQELLEFLKEYRIDPTKDMLALKEPLNFRYLQQIEKYLLREKLQCVYVENPGNLGPEGCPVKGVLKVSPWKRNLDNSYSTATASCANCKWCAKSEVYESSVYSCLLNFKRPSPPPSYPQISPSEISDRFEGDIDRLDPELLTRDGLRFSRRLMVWDMFQARYEVELHGFCLKFKERKEHA